MVPKETKALTAKELMREIYVVLLGVPGTDEGGAIQSIKEIEKHLRELNCAVKINTVWRKALAWMIGVIFTCMTLLIAYLVTGNLFPI